MFRIEVPHLPPPLNDWYSGVHWRKRKETADEWHGLFIGAFQDAKLPKKLGKGLTLDVTEYCRYLRDSDSAVVAAKLCGDALVLGGYIPDDNPEWITTVVLRSVKAKEDKTVVLILRNETGYKFPSTLDGGMLD